MRKVLYQLLYCGYKICQTIGSEGFEKKGV